MTDITANPWLTLLQISFTDSKLFTRIQWTDPILHLHTRLFSVQAVVMSDTSGCCTKCLFWRKYCTIFSVKLSGRTSNGYYVNSTWYSRVKHYFIVRRGNWKSKVLTFSSLSNVEFTYFQTFGSWESSDVSVCLMADHYCIQSRKQAVNCQSIEVIMKTNSNYVVIYVKHLLLLNT